MWWGAGGSGVWSLVGELRFHMLWGAAKTWGKKRHVGQFCSCVYTPGRFSHGVLEDISFRISSVLLWQKTLKSQWMKQYKFIFCSYCMFITHWQRSLYSSSLFETHSEEVILFWTLFIPVPEGKSAFWGFLNGQFNVPTQKWHISLFIQFIGQNI